MDDKGKITKRSIAARLDGMDGGPDDEEERRALDEYAAILRRQADLRASLKEAEDELNAAVAERYGKLTEEAIKDLVVNDKWLARLAADVRGELDRVSQGLTGRIQQLAERYATPLPQLIGEVDALAARVDAHLRTIGTPV